MDNDEREKKDTLSEILSRNKERRLKEESDEVSASSDVDNAGLYHEESLDLPKNDESEFYESPHADFFNEAEGIDDDNLHDIEFDEETEKPITDKALKRAREARKQLKKQREARNTAIRIFLGAVISVVVIFFGVNLGTKLYNIITDYGGMGNNEFEVAVEIPENPTVDQVADILHESGIVQEPGFFKLYFNHKSSDSEWRHSGEVFAGGEFLLSSSMNYSSIIDTLMPSGSGRGTVEVTIIEGMTAAEIGRLLEEKCVCRAEDFEKFYREKMDKYDFERRVTPDPLKFNQLEGYLFPDKYEFYECRELKANPEGDIDTSDEAEEAARKIYSNFNSKITKVMYKQMNSIGLTLNDLITLASMVQSEVSDVEDMRKVASVFLNRLEAGEEFSKLQSDVTVFYVQDFIEPYYDGYGLDTSLAAISEAYDTYECDGIPAGPICNPGMDAINAVLDAEPTDYYYFCANEETGETFYAKTLEEHEENLVLAGLK